MLFSKLTELYLIDLKLRVRRSTYRGKSTAIKRYILPTFGVQEFDKITAADIRYWQGMLLGKGCFAESTLRLLHGHLSSIFNYAVKFHGLGANPCHQAGPMGSLRVGNMTIWTVEEFRQFLFALAASEWQLRDERRCMYIAVFSLLYWTGCRVGEVLALTRADIDFNKGIIHINKSQCQIDGQIIISSPKTFHSVRKVWLPRFIIDILDDYCHLCELSANEFIFSISRSSIRHALNKGADLAGLSRLRIHDLRHSHVSLLTNIGVSPLIIADRLGHDSYATTLRVYAHIYQNKQAEVVAHLENLTC